MAKYIDADLLPELFDKEYKGTVNLIKNGATHLNNIAEGFLEAYQVVLKIPAADVDEVRHGRWICGDYYDNHYNPIFECSSCNKEVADRFIKNHNYCLHCGAKMDLE